MDDKTMKGLIKIDEERRREGKIKFDPSEDDCAPGLFKEEGGKIKSPTNRLEGNQGDENILPTRLIKREVVIMLYTAQLYLPGLFQRKAFLIVSLLLPFVDVATDWMNAGIGLQLMFQYQPNCLFVKRGTFYCEPSLGRVITEPHISPAARSTSMAMFINLTVNPMISGLVISGTSCSFN